jgi:RHS repeat-associated protein
LLFGYDWQSRRSSKTVSNQVSGIWYLASDLRFIYDGWNLLAILNPPSAIAQQFMWGLDLSGTLQGAGGVGGLIKVYDNVGNKHYFAAYDGNGNVLALVDGNTGAEAARYEHGPCGETLVLAGSYAQSNPVRFSTKFTDDETGMLYYGYRYYIPSFGRWPSRDPIGEVGGLNLYRFLHNQALSRWDYLGLLSAGGGTAHTSVIRHNNYLSFTVACPRGQKVANVSVDYSRALRGLLALGLVEEMLEQAFDGVFNGAGDLGGLRDVKTPNCFGRAVTVTAYMRTRLSTQLYLDFFHLGIPAFQVYQRAKRLEHIPLALLSTMSVLTAAPRLGYGRQHLISNLHPQHSLVFMLLGPDDLVMLFTRYLPSVVCCVLASILIGLGIILTKRLRMALGYYVILPPLIPLVCWVLYFAATSKLAVTLTLLDSESASVAERTYSSSFKKPVTTYDQAIRLAVDKRQPPNVRFYASCLLAEMLATKNNVVVAATLKRLDGAPEVETQFIGENELTREFYVSGHEQSRLLVREIVERRLSHLKNDAHLNLNLYAPTKAPVVPTN